MLKKLTIAATSLALAFAISACGKKAGGPGKKQTKSNSAPAPKGNIPTPSVDGSWLYCAGNAGEGSYSQRLNFANGVLEVKDSYFFSPQCSGPEDKSQGNTDYYYFEVESSNGNVLNMLYQDPITMEIYEGQITVNTPVMTIDSWQYNKQ